jgi:hypothetical protein
MNIDEAIGAHTRWKLKLSAYLLHPDHSLDPATVAQDQRCDLGQWIHGEGRKYASLPEIKTLEADHARFHKAASNVVSKADSGQNVSLEIALGAHSEFASASTAIVTSLMAMKRHLAK